MDNNACVHMYVWMERETDRYQQQIASFPAPETECKECCCISQPKFLQSQSLINGLLATTTMFKNKHRLNTGDAWTGDTVCCQKSLLKLTSCKSSFPHIHELLQAADIFMTRGYKLWQCINIIHGTYNMYCSKYSNHRLPTKLLLNYLFSLSILKKTDDLLKML